MITIRILRTTGMGEQGVAVPGDEVEVSQELAQQLVGNGRAEHVKGTLYEASKADDEAKDETAAKDEKKAKAKRKRKARAKKAADAKAEEAAEEEDEEEETEEAPFVVETATTEAPEDATFPRYR